MKKNSSEIAWEPTLGPQKRALSISIDELLYGGSRGCGKTDIGIVWISVPACGELANPRYRGLVIRKNSTDMVDWIDRATQFYAPMKAKRRGNPPEFIFPNGALIRCGHLKDADAFNKYLGHEYQRILIEELTQIPREEDYLRLLSSCRSTIPELKPSVFCTTNPGGRGHGWCKKRFVDPCEHGIPFQDQDTKRWRVFIKALPKDNPFLDSSYWRTLQELPEHLRKAWVDGNWDILAGKYFPEWDEKVHVCKPFPIPSHWEKFVSIDWGYSPDPWVALFWAIDENGTVFLYHEMSGNEMIPSEVARRITAFLPSQKIVAAWGDPSMWAKKDSPDSTAKQMQDSGLYTLQKANNERIQGWTRVHEYLTRGRLRIFSSCAETIRCLPELIHDDDNPQDSMGDSLIDHHPDAMRYFLMSRPIASEPVKPKKIFLSSAQGRAYRVWKEAKKRKREDEDF